MCHALCPPNLNFTGEYPHQILVQWLTPTSIARDKTKNCNGWDLNTNFKWKHDLKYFIPNWQPIGCILATWPLPEDEGFEPLKITISLEQIEFAQNNLHRCYAQEHGQRVIEEDVGVASARRGSHGRATGGHLACDYAQCHNVNKLSLEKLTNVDKYYDIGN